MCSHVLWSMEYMFHGVHGQGQASCKSLGETYIAMSYGIGIKNHNSSAMPQCCWKHFTMVKDRLSKPYRSIR